MIFEFIKTVNGIVWGPIMLTLLLGVGIILTVGLKGLTLRKIPFAFKQLKKSGDVASGDISPFKALMTSLSATIGTGNIAGVATAITLGGPGALFWMWITALVGMATKYAEALLAVQYRETNPTGEFRGGPMYYIKNGLGANWQWLALAFAFFGTVAGFGIGNTVQSNSIAAGLEDSFSIAPWVSGVVVAIIVAAVVIGGIKRIGNFAGKIVPIMAIAYLLAGSLILVVSFEQIPAAFMLIIDSAFNGQAAAGGFAGAGVMAAIQFGVARGIFSNEAGLGSAPIAHAHSQTKSPVNQGFIAMLGTFIDTIIVCSITGLVIIISGEWMHGAKGAVLTSQAFAQSLGNTGHYIVIVGLCVFAFTTIIGWCVYGERCVTYLFGEKAALPFRVLWIAAIPLGAIMDLDKIWLIADTFNALMAIPNLVALLLLSPVVFKLTKEALKNDPALQTEIKTE